MAIYPDKRNGKLTGRYLVELKGGGGRYRRRWDSLPDAKKDEAAVEATWARGDVLAGSQRPQGAPDVHTFASTFPVAQGNLWRGNSTEAQVWGRMKIIANILGPNFKLDDIDTAAIDRLSNGLRKRGIEDSSVNRYLAHLGRFLKWAEARDYRTVTLAKLDYGKSRETAGRLRWISVEEEQALKAFLEPKAPHVWALVSIAIATGCRRAELMGAQSKDIHGTLLHLYADRTKTKTFRTVPMTQETADTLRDLIDSGNMPTNRNLRSWWERARENMGLADDPEFVFHITRHTCATRMVDAGVNIIQIKEWLGHKLVATTQRYAHVRPETLLTALDMVGAFAERQAQNSRLSRELAA